jgi:hypothetical protein
VTGLRNHLRHHLKGPDFHHDRDDDDDQTMIGAAHVHGVDDDDVEANGDEELEDGDAPGGLPFGSAT